MTISEGKRRRLAALANDRGVIAAAAIDQRGALQKALAVARGVDVKDITPRMISEFKTIVTRALAPYASGVLLDPEFGMEAARARGRHCGLLLAYEMSGYNISRPGRLPELIPQASVKRLVDWGADAVKVALYYTPFEEPAIRDLKHAIIERVGAECEAHEVPFFLEFVGYDPRGGDERCLEYARNKPEIVRRSMEEFSKPQYKVDVLKVEIPVNLEYVEDSGFYRGQKASTRVEALYHFKDAAAAASKPFIYLSAGVSSAQFIECLRMASEAGADFSGVLCGRATWKDGIAVYARRGARALEEWMHKEGAENINAVNRSIATATPWFEKLGLSTSV